MVTDTLRESIILDPVSVQPDLSRILARLRFNDPAGHLSNLVPELLKEFSGRAHPRALYRIGSVAITDAGSVKIDGVIFDNPLLKVNLAKVEKIFPFVITCGSDADRLAVRTSEERYCLQVIREVYLNALFEYLQEYLLKSYALDFIWSLVSGELQAFPISARRGLFNILGDVEKAIGVRLRQDFSLEPACSRCGFFYYTPLEFESCQLCPREPCMGRRAPYSPELVRRYREKGLSFRLIAGCQHIRQLASV